MLIATTFNIAEIADRLFVCVYVASQTLILNLPLQQKKKRKTKTSRKKQRRPR